jgi:hypothetical protein
LRVLCSGMGGRPGQGARGLASVTRDATQTLFCMVVSPTRKSVWGFVGLILTGSRIGAWPRRPRAWERRVCAASEAADARCRWAWRSWWPWHRSNACNQHRACRARAGRASRSASRAESTRNGRAESTRAGRAGTRCRRGLLPSRRSGSGDSTRR